MAPSSDDPILAAYREQFDSARTALTLQDREDLANELLSYNQGDDIFLTRLGRTVREAGLTCPSVTIEYRGVNVATDASVGSSAIATVGNVPLGLAKRLLGQGGSQTQKLPLLKDLQGVLRPGRLTLLLGPPSCGKSTFLKLLSGRLKVGGKYTAEGSVLYNGESSESFHMQRTAAFADQIDNHNPNLTVRETLDFAYDCQMGLHGPEFSLPLELARARAKAPSANTIMASLGELLHCERTPNGRNSLGGLFDGGRTCPIMGSTHTHVVANAAPPTMSSHQSRRHATGALRREEPGTCIIRQQTTSRGGFAAAWEGDCGAHSGREAARPGPQQERTRQEGRCSDAVPAVEVSRPAATNSPGSATSSVSVDHSKTKKPSTGVMAAGDDGFEALLRRVWGTGVKVDIIMKVMGLWNCKETLVGDAQTRGISGGERKRLTAAEQLVGPRPVIIMDEISTGLDSATLFSIIKWLGQAVHALQLNIVISLLQPPPEVAAMFDDIILMTEGQIIYHGPVTDTLPFFERLGFACPARKDVPSFLLEITTASGQLEYAGAELRKKHKLPADEDFSAAAKANSPFRHKMMVDVDFMVDAFWNSNVHGVKMKADLAGKPFVKGTGHPHALCHSSLALSPFEAIALAFRRQMLLVLRDTVLLKGRMIQVTVIGLITGSVFYLTPITVNGAYTYFGFLFMTLLFMNFGGFPQIPITIDGSRVFFKHRDNHFLPPYAQAIALALTQLPLSILDAGIFSIITFFLVGFYRDPAYFFTHYLLLISISANASSVFRLVGTIAPSMTIANAMAGGFLIVFIVTAGFAIVRSAIPAYIIWLYWLSPFSYALRALCINELTSPRWDFAVSATDPTYMGHSVLLAFDFFTDRKWIWLQWADRWQPPLLSLTDMKLAANALNWCVAEMENRYRLLSELRVRNLAGYNQKIREARAAGEPLFNPFPTHVETPELLDTLPLIVVLIDELADLMMVAGKKIEELIARLAQKARAAGIHLILATQRPSVDVITGLIKANIPTRVAFQVSSKIDSRTILDQMGAEALLGQGDMLFLPPGTCKTTLMDVIAGRKTVGEITGDIWVNGKPKDQRSWSRVMGYVEQNDIHSPAPTVVESLIFSSRLRLPKSVSDEKVRQYVAEVMDIVDLTDIQYNQVGMSGVSGLSVEQRKRLTIAVELVANPSVVFMDEPTSGLDARAAQIVMRAVRNVARSGRTVMPLLSGFNPATWMLEVTGGSMATTVVAVAADWPAIYAASAVAEEVRDRVRGVVDRDLRQGQRSHRSLGPFRNTHTRRTRPKNSRVLVVSQVAELMNTDADHHKGHDGLVVSSQYAMDFGTQTKALLTKFMITYWRSPGYNVTRLGMTLVVALLYGAIYYRLALLPNPAAFADVQNSLGVMYSSGNFLGMTNLMSAMAVIGYERIVFYRERGSSMYDPFAYGLAIATVEIPYLLAQATMFVPIVYFMVGFTPTAWQFFYYFIVLFETVAFYTIFGQFLVYVTPSQAIAQVLGGASNFLFNIFMGYVIVNPAIPGGWEWMNRFAPTTWILYGLGTSQLGDDQTPLDNQGTTTTVAQFLQDHWGYHYYMRWYIVAIVAAYIIFVRVSSILALKYINFLKR
ncbi:MAG: hypothetical protein WDW38_003787 [Sanguina aurantia]